jgi:pimeloyl-ACP methyl ester carboxylesterase
MWSLVVVAAVALLGLPLLFSATVYATWTPPPADPEAFRMPPGSGVRAFLGEWIGVLSMLVTQPFALRPERRDGGGLIVFVPETRCSGASFWLVRRRLRGLGWSMAASRAAASVDRLDAAVGALDACIGRIAVADTPLVLIGHGLGGLVARRYAATCAPNRVRHVVMLATPHRGTTSLAYRLLCAGDPSPAALALAAAGAPTTDVITIAGDYDAWLAPADDNYCPGAFNITVRGLGHCELLLSGRVAALIAENLASTPPRA